MVKITFIDSNYVEFPRGATGSVVAFGELDTIYEILDAWLDNTLGEGKYMNWMTAVVSASKSLDAAKIMVTKDVDRHVGPELRVWLEHRKIDVVGRAEPQAEFVTFEPIEQADQKKDYTRVMQYTEPPTPRMTEMKFEEYSRPPEPQVIEYERKDTPRVFATEEMEISEAIRS